MADLAFFSDLLPCLSHSEGLELLKDLASGLGTSREERRRCLRGLARNGRNGPSAPARLCLQRFLEVGGLLFEGRPVLLFWRGFQGKPQAHQQAISISPSG